MNQRKETKMKTKVYWLTLLASAVMMTQTQAHGFGGGGASFGGAHFRNEEMGSRLNFLTFRFMPVILLRRAAAALPRLECSNSASISAKRIGLSCCFRD